MIALMFMSSQPLHWPKVLSTASMPKSDFQTLKKQGWWRPTRGFLVEPPKGERYTWQQHCYLGYVRALVRQYPGGVVFAGTTAAMLLGYPVWPSPVDILAYKNGGRCEARELPSHPYSARKARFRSMNGRTITRAIDLGHGVYTTTHEQTAVDVARLAASETAFIIVCSILGRLATSGDIYQDRTDP